MPRENRERVRVIGQKLLIPVQLLRPDPDQPRKHFDGVAIDDLGGSMSSVKQLTPVVVRDKPRADGTYLIIEGERRWRAARSSGITALEAVTESVANRDHHFLLSCIANFNREGHTAEEITSAIQRLMRSEFVRRLAAKEKAAKIAAAKGSGRKTRAKPEVTKSDLIAWIAKAFGKTSGWVSMHLKLQRLEEDIRSKIKPPLHQRGLTFAAANELASAVPDDVALQRKIAKKIIDEDLTSKETRNLIQRELVSAGQALERKDGAGRKSKHSFLGRVLKNLVKQVQESADRVLSLDDAQIAAVLGEFTRAELLAMSRGIDASVIQLKRLSERLKTRLPPA